MKPNKLLVTKNIKTGHDQTIARINVGESVAINMDLSLCFASPRNGLPGAGVVQPWRNVVPGLAASEEIFGEETQDDEMEGGHDVMRERQEPASRWEN